MKYINKIVVSNQEPPINTLWIEGDSLKYYNNGWKEICSSQEEVQKLLVKTNTLEYRIGQDYIELATKIKTLDNNFETLAQTQEHQQSTISATEGKVNSLKNQILNPSKLQVADPKNLTLADLNLIMGDLKARGIISISTKS